MSWRAVNPDDWVPRGIGGLEPSAEEALRHGGSTAVIAGPGAGKTEFLAQRAAYLLETGLCESPRQILAISFKSDAAENLAERVRARCLPELSSRFVSLTFDAFTKSLVDRFHSAIPNEWRPTKPYEIVFPTRRQVEGKLSDVRDAAPQKWQAAIAQLNPSLFEAEVVGVKRLPLRKPVTATGAAGFAALEWWDERLRGKKGVSQLTFVCLNRLAELIVRANPKIVRAIRATYPFVFIDEFQDTTHAQYDFLISTFGGSASTMTAVGDHKQRIMLWAGARVDAFEQFSAEFNAHRTDLLFNFRSSPELVRVQHYVARALDASAPRARSKAASQLSTDVVQIWTSDSQRKESDHLATWIASDMSTRGKRPRDYVILVRQLADQFQEELHPRFEAVGLSVRNESKQLGRMSLQDLLTDPVARLALSVLHLGIGRRNARAWSTFAAAVYLLRGAEEEAEVRRQATDLEINRFLTQFRARMRSVRPSEDAVGELTRLIFGFLDASAIKRTHAAYARNDLLEIVVEAFELHLASSAEGVKTWPACLEKYEGIGDVPMMTVHKSKGLEFDTVLCLGMDDQSWWSHTPGNPEGVATFFVALSRAKQRAVFLFCQARGTRKKVADLYRLLTDAGVPETKI